MKKVLPYAIRHLLIARSGFFLWLLLFGCNSKQDEHKHDQIQTIPESMDHGHQQIDTAFVHDSDEETFWNALPANQIVISKQLAIPVIDSSQQFTIEGEGYISFDPGRNRKISVRIGGRIERLYVKYDYQYIRKGDKILDIYSPELNTYVAEYIYLNRTNNDRELTDKSKQKLLSLGLTVAQIAQMDNSSTAPSTFSLYSPFEGFVLSSPSGTLGPSSGSASQDGMGDGMNGRASVSSSGSAGTVLGDNSIREGMYVSKDQAIFWVNDFQTVWGIVAFSHENEKMLKPGLEVIVRSELFPGRTFRSVIQMVEPVYMGAQKFTQIRLFFSNPDRKLKQNSLISARAYVNSGAITVPASSLYFVGSTAIVWVLKSKTKEGSNVFQARTIKIGRRVNQQFEVLNGLSRDDFIAKDAAYLADSETIIQY